MLKEKYVMFGFEEITLVWENQNIFMSVQHVINKKSSLRKKNLSHGGGDGSFHPGSRQ
jgi:hypothetical protein